MVEKKGIYLFLCLFLFFGCTPVQTEMTKRITVAPAAERTICIQTDPAIVETAQIIIPLETELGSKGYRIVATPEQASYTLRLELINFGLRGWPPVPQASSPAGPVKGIASGERLTAGQSAPVIGSAAGTAIGGAVSGSALHAGLTTGGAVGGLVGAGAGLLLGGGSSSYFEPFIGKVNVSINESLLGIPPQQTELTARVKVHKKSQIAAAQKAVAEKLAAQIAALMP